METSHNYQHNTDGNMKKKSTWSDDAGPVRNEDGVTGLPVARADCANGSDGADDSSVNIEVLQMPRKTSSRWGRFVPAPRWLGVVLLSLVVLYVLRVWVIARRDPDGTITQLALDCHNRRPDKQGTDQSGFFCFWRTHVLFLGPLVPLFWISGDVSSGFQSQSGFCLIRYFCGGKCNVRSPRSTSGRSVRLRFKFPRLRSWFSGFRVFHDIWGPRLAASWISKRSAGVAPGMELGKCAIKSAM